MTTPVSTRRGSAWNAHITVAHLLVAGLGIAALVWTASPLTYDGWIGSGGWWLPLVVSALLCGGVGGLLEGSALATGHRVLAGLILLAAAVPAIWIPFLAVGRWLGDQDYVFGTTSLFEPIIGWLMFVAVITTTAATVAAASSRREAKTVTADLAGKTPR